MIHGDHIPYVSPGDQLSAERDRKILDLLRRGVTAPGLAFDERGLQLWIPWQRRQIMRFEMTAELLLPQSGAGSAEADALVWSPTAGAWEELGDPVTVVDSMRMHSKMATATGDVGAYGLAWVADDPPVDSPYEADWEILTMQTPGPFFGVAQSSIDFTDPSVTVTAFDILAGGGHKTLSGYDPFGDSFGNDITVYNPPRSGAGSPYWFVVHEDETVFCVWHMRENRYYMVNVLAHVEVNGFDAASDPVTVRPCYQIDYDPGDFIVTESSSGVANIALR